MDENEQDRSTVEAPVAATRVEPARPTGAIGQFSLGVLLLIVTCEAVAMAALGEYVIPAQVFPYFAYVLYRTIHRGAEEGFIRGGEYLLRFVSTGVAAGAVSFVAGLLLVFLAGSILSQFGGMMVMWRDTYISTSSGAVEIPLFFVFWIAVSTLVSSAYFVSSWRWAIDGPLSAPLVPMLFVALGVVKYKRLLGDVDALVEFSLYCYLTAALLAVGGLLGERTRRRRTAAAIAQAG